MKKPPPKKTSKKKAAKKAVKNAAKKPAKYSAKNSEKPSSLRREAEKRLKKQTARLEALSTRGTKNLVHELGTHQVELEMQNEELRRSQEELETSRRKYADLYDFAPIGYFTFDKEGVILEANLTGATMLGMTRRFLVHQLFTRFVADSRDRDTFSRYLSSIVKRQTKSACELRIRGKDGVDFIAELQSVPAEGERGAPLVRTAITDITERKQAEEASRASRSRLETVFAAVPNPIIEFDADGVPVMANEAALKALGVDSPDFTRANAAAKLKFEGLDGSAVALDDLPVARALRGEAVSGELYRIQTVNGIRRVISTYATPLVGENGKIQGAVSLWHDITGLKHAEEALRRSEEQFRLAIENAPIPVIMHADDGEVLQVSRTWTELTGYTIADIRTFDEWTTHAVYGEGADEVRNYLRGLFRNSSSSSSSSRLEFAIRTKGGEVRHWSFSASVPGTLSDGRHYIVGMAEDITDRKQAEKALRESEARQKAIFDNSPMAIFVKDRQGRYLLVNTKGADWLKNMNVAQSAIGKTDFDLFPREQAEEFTASDREIITTRTVETKEEDIRQPDGKHTFIEHKFPLIDSAGEVYAVAGIATDITERKNAEAAVKAANAQLELKMIELAALNKELEAFNYSVSHDLRAPLRHIEGFAHVLLDGYSDKLDDTGRDYLRRVSSGAQKMKDLVDALLSLSQYTRANLNRTKVYLSSMVRTAAEERRHGWPERAVELVVAEGVTAEGDQTMLQVVINNLIGNAWKFTQNRSDARIEFGVTEQAGTTVYFIRDNGVGFNKEYGERLFIPFQRLHTHEEFPGMGIGLATVQRIIHRHGGRIWAEGEVGKGATFYFTLG